MARLLVVHHTPSPAMQELLESALAGARDPALADLGGAVDVQVRPALTAGPVDALEADGYLLATPRPTDHGELRFHVTWEAELQGD